jgi:nucleoside-diphosphate-sugar epimerase
MTTQTTTAQSRIALVLGITGGVGGATAEALARHGWTIRALARDPDAARARSPFGFPVDWRKGDAMIADQVIDAAKGAALIIHGVNPPGYRNWRGLALPMLANTIAAARVSGARIVFPGNVYNFGPDAGSLIDESAPQRPRTRKGKIRVEMERRLLAESRNGVKSLIVRAGDFFGRDSQSSWFSQLVARGGRRARRVFYLGRPDAGHCWAYLPDLAQTIVRLIDRASMLADCETIHFGGHWFESGRGMAEAVRDAIGNPGLPIYQFPWMIMILGAPFATFMRESLEMRYLWESPLRLDNRKLVGLLGSEPHTPLPQAVAAALDEADRSAALQGARAASHSARISAA